MRDCPACVDGETVSPPFEHEDDSRDRRATVGPSPALAATRHGRDLEKRAGAHGDVEMPSKPRTAVVADSFEAGDSDGDDESVPEESLPVAESAVTVDVLGRLSKQLLLTKDWKPTCAVILDRRELLCFKSGADWKQYKDAGAPPHGKALEALIKLRVRLHGRHVCLGIKSKEYKGHGMLHHFTLEEPKGHKDKGASFSPSVVAKFASQNETTLFSLLLLLRNAISVAPPYSADDGLRTDAPAKTGVKRLAGMINPRAALSKVVKSGADAVHRGADAVHRGTEAVARAAPRLGRTKPKTIAAGTARDYSTHNALL
ncbi:hypothetical protein M885DRAFT_562872 [Pelagophyceae sp. CCMP2097]|nr:hypothetical protein M885DRAFT_562872 [Pelagophyceae sp. CCMP2097]